MSKGRNLLDQEANDFVVANPRTQENLGRPVGAAKVGEAKDILRQKIFCDVWRKDTPSLKYEIMPHLACAAFDLWPV